MFKIIFKMIKENLVLFLLISFFMLLSNAVGYSIPYLFKIFADKLSHCSLSEILLYVAGLICTGILSYISVLLADKFFLIYSEKFAFLLRDAISKKIYSSKFDLFNNTDLNVFSRIIVSDSEEIKGVCTTMIFSIISIVFEAIILIFFMFKLEWKIAIICIAWNLLFFIFTNKMSSKIIIRILSSSKCQVEYNDTLGYFCLYWIF